MIDDVVIKFGNVIEREHVVMGIRLPQADDVRLRLPGNGFKLMRFCL
jgi:hypothetical protein